MNLHHFSIAHPKVAHFDNINFEDSAGSLIKLLYNMRINPFYKQNSEIFYYNWEYFPTFQRGQFVRIWNEYFSRY